jgi:lipopolysaccharide/colanic/teichoic acid biosynthesis glycosyltransferase
LKRIFDISFSALFLILLSPLFLIFIIWISADSPGGPFFRQVRVGLNGKEFKLFKFRSMRPMAEAQGQLTVGMKDNRITKAGYVLRKYKIDELPQLLNIFLGDMSVVGPRPEVPKYVAMYSAEQRQVLSVRPGLTDYASLEYFKENELLAASANPEKTYIDEVMPAKLALNMKYIQDMSLAVDISIIWRTVKAIFS